MSFLNSIQNQSKKHETPFIHWEYNNALTDGAIKEIITADIPDVSRSEERRVGKELEIWNYQKLDETNRVANIIKQKIKP